MLWHIGKLDNLRKHQRLLAVEDHMSRRIVHRDRPGPRFREADDPQWKTKPSLVRIPVGALRPHKGNTNVTAEIFLNEAPVGVGDPANFDGLESLHFPRVEAVNSEPHGAPVRITVPNDVPSGPEVDQQDSSGQTYLARTLSPMQLVAMEDGKAHKCVSRHHRFGFQRS